MKKDDLSLALAVLALALDLSLGPVAVLVVLAFLVGVLVGPRLSSFLKD